MSNKELRSKARTLYLLSNSLFLYNLNIEPATDSAFLEHTIPYLELPNNSSVPGTSVDITGFPNTKASHITVGKPSVSDVKTNKSAAFK